MSKNVGKFVWYDVMTSDTKAAESFYRSVIGWDAKDSGKTDRSYTLFSAGPAIVGGLMPIPEEARAEDLAIVRRRYLNAHPSSEVFVDFKDFSFFRIRPAAAHLVAGFGRIVDLRPAQLLTDISDAAALLEAEPGVIDHMNADHREAMNLYATRLLGAPDADWRCTGCDPEGIDMAAGARVLRLEFPRRIVTPVALRQLLRELADQARAAASH